MACDCIAKDHHFQVAFSQSTATDKQHNAKQYWKPRTDPFVCSPNVLTSYYIRLNFFDWLWLCFVTAMRNLVFSFSQTFINHQQSIIMHTWQQLSCLPWRSPFLRLWNAFETYKPIILILVDWQNHIMIMSWAYHHILRNFEIWRPDSSAKKSTTNKHNMCCSPMSTLLHNSTLLATFSLVWALSQLQWHSHLVGKTTVAVKLRRSESLIK